MFKAKTSGCFIEKQSATFTDGLFLGDFLKIWMDDTTFSDIPVIVFVDI
jgi:hypothetical protein